MDCLSVFRPIAFESRDGGGDCPEDLTCVRCRASSVDQEALLIAEDVLAAFRNVTRQRARREWFAQAFGPASERSKDDPVHVIMADDGWYGDMALNWFAVASDRGIPGLVSGAVRSGLLFGIDDEIVRKATRSGIPAFTMREYDARIPAALQGKRWLGVKRWAWALQADLYGNFTTSIFRNFRPLISHALNSRLLRHLCLCSAPCLVPIPRGAHAPHAH